MKNGQIRSKEPRLILNHLVEEQKFDVAVSPSLAGPALLDRIGDLNRSRLLPLIERLFDEYDRPGELIRIDRLVLDLGRFEGSDLAGVEARLETTLRKALAAATADARPRPEGERGAGFAAGPERLPIGAALAAMVEHYLLHGVWPYGSGVDSAAAPATLLARLIADESAALAAMLRRPGAADHSLRRLVRQLPEAGLRALLHRLAPAHAALAISCLDEIRAGGEAAAPAGIDENLWTALLRDALGQEGPAGDREAVLQRLLGRLAAAPSPVAALAGLLGFRLERALTPKRTGALRRLFALGLARHRIALRWLVGRLAHEDSAGLAERIEGALPLDAVVTLLVGEAAAARFAGPAPTKKARASLLRRAAAQTSAAAEPEAAATPVEALAHLLDGDAGDADTLLRALERARGEDAIALRRLLRDLAAADARRLRRRLAMPPPALAAWLLPPHLAAVLVALAEAASCGPRQWDALLEAAGRASETELPATLERRAWAVLRRRPAAAFDRHRREAERLARLYSALDQAEALWSGRAPFSPAERARALGLLLPKLSGIPSNALRQRLRAAIGDMGAPPDLDVLTAAQLRRLALLLAPAGEVRERLRTIAPAALVRALAGNGEAPAELAPEVQACADIRAALDAALAAGGGPDRALAAVRALIGARALRPARLARALDGAPEDMLARWLAVLAPPASAAGRAAGEMRAMIAALIAGEDIAPGAPWSGGALALAAMLRTRPLAAIRRLAANAPDPVDEALPGMLAAPERAALLFAALPAAEREQAMALGRLLTGRAGRAAIAPSKVARALAATAAALASGSAGAAAASLWLDALTALASPRERAALARLPGERPAPPPHAPGQGEGALVRVLARIAPDSAPDLLHAAERIAAAREAAGAGVARAALWRALLAAASRDAGDVAPLVDLLFDGGEDAPEPPPARAEQSLRAALEDARDAPLRAALDLRQRARPPAPAEESRPALAAGAGPIHVVNAGLVLVSAYLPRLFRMLDFLAPDASGRHGWKSAGLRDRAVHLVQWLADGRCDAPEPLLALNKLLCGMHPSEPVTAAIEPTKAELDACEALLNAVLANWPPLKSSTPDALRETFLQRHGRLEVADDGWLLEVERKVLDILIDQLPWGYSTILHPWMRAPISVNWG